MKIKRDLSKTLKRFSKFPVVVLLGPRQSGKTTLIKQVFNKHLYFNLEDPEVLDFISKDVKGFLGANQNKYGIIFDEFQNYPKLLSYLQIEVDEKDRPGYFVLTGSQNFLMNEAISQSLAGRAGILTLLPLSIEELKKAKLLSTVDSFIVQGGYPRLHVNKFTPQEIFPSYIRQYLERDVRQLVNVGNLRTFQRFMQLCAGRVGQQLNIEDLAMNCGISRTTVNSWLSILEASYIIFLLKPYFKKFNRRITKTPKLYFFDTGLACSLLGIKSAKVLALSPFRGPLFECLIISDFYKQYYNMGMTAEALYYWRDQNGRLEIDSLIDLVKTLVPVEIKSGATIMTNYFDTITQWGLLSGSDPSKGYIIYAGDSEQARNAGHVISWKSAGELINKLEKSD